MSTNAPASRRTVTAPDAPPALGPYTHAVRHGDPLFCSGALPLRPDTARVAVGVAALPRNARVQIDAIVAVS